MAAKQWKKGRGKLGPFAPLLGTWSAEGESPRGRGRYTRTFSRVLDGTHVQLIARWEFPDYAYDEVAFFGVNRDGKLAFWSFTSDGKQSQGELADVSDLHPEALGFAAEMPGGYARQAYLPDTDGGMQWIVQVRIKQGWSRLIDHHYRNDQQPRS